MDKVRIFYMITFLVGLGILALGYIFYSKYVVSQFSPTDCPTPAFTKNDKIDFISAKTKACLETYIQELNYNIDLLFPCSFYWCSL